MKIIALDFDGVICDSVRELAISGYRGAGIARCERVGDTPPKEFMNDFIALRPVIETGYESIILAELILRRVESSERIIGNFKANRRRIMDDFGLTRNEMIKLFGNVRDQWINEDLDGWLACHSFYPGILRILDDFVKQERQVFIVTTKEKRFAYQLLKSHNVDIPKTHIFGLRDGRKSTVLKDVIQANRRKNSTICFVEDRLKTLEVVGNDKRLAAIELYLATWGYNTPKQRRKARDSSRIRLLTISNLARL